MTDIQLSKSEEKELEQLINNLLSYCRKKDIPIFLSIVIENSKEGTVYKNAVLSPGANNIVLKDDKIRQFILIANGSHEAVFKRDNLEIRMSDLINLQKAVPKPDIDNNKEQET